MRIRRDSVFISSVLFTIALLCLIPPCLANALTGRSRTALQELDAGFRAAAQLMGDLGIISLAIIFIGLIVTWTGFIKGVRWTWFVMCIIVWAWAFPLLILPFLGHTIVPTWSEILSNALREPGIARSFVQLVLIFSLMVIALILPIKSFFLSRRPPAPVVDHRRDSQAGFRHRGQASSRVSQSMSFPPKLNH